MFPPQERIGWATLPCFDLCAKADPRDRLTTLPNPRATPVPSRWNTRTGRNRLVMCQIRPKSASFSC